MTTKLEEFRSCMRKGMSSVKFKTREDRNKFFCLQAKTCSGKKREEAIAECKAKHPKWEYPEEEK